MFTIKKPAIIVVLMVLLVFTGYINHKLTQQSLLNASNDYQSHEEMEMLSKAEDDKQLAETTSEKNGKDNIKKDDMEIIDDKANGNVSDLTKEVNSNISKTLSKKSSSKAKNYFIEHRLARDKLRGSLIEQLNNIVNNDKTDAKVRKEAQEEVIRIGRVSEKELCIEGLIKAKGFDDVVVFLEEDEARVVVFAEELSEQDMVKILNIVKDETKLDTRQIKVMKKN